MISLIQCNRNYSFADNAWLFLFGDVMAKEWAKKFYQSSAWINCRAGYLNNHVVCEICESNLAKIVHHKIRLNPKNISDPYITLSWDNLQAVCQDCHNGIDGRVGRRYRFTADGSVVPVDPVVSPHR